MKAKSSHFLSIAFMIGIAITGCASIKTPSGSDYDEPVIPGKTKVLNMTGKPTTEGAAEIYFGASSRVEMMITFRDRLVAFELDDVTLPGAKSGYTPTGYQAIAVTPGVHTISYCHITRSDLGTGVVMCDFKVKNYNFEADSRYMVIGAIGVRAGSSSGTTGQTATVRTNIVKLQ
jgi:hypothetical protein